MKILFVHPPVDLEESELDSLKSSSPSLGLLSLAAVARQKGHEVRFMDRRFDPSEFWEFCPHVTAFTAMTVEYESANSIARWIKERHTSRTIIGGNHVTAVDDAYDNFDWVCKGEGEWQFLEYLGEDPSAYHSLDDIPFPAFDLVDWSKYRLSPMGTKRDKSIGLVTSRGCFGKCTFCSRAVFGNIYRFNSAEYVVNEMRFLRERFGISDFLFYDDLFVGNKLRLVKFCELIKGEGFTWSCCSRVDFISREIAKMMKDSGCWMIEFGIESGSQKILNLMKKGITLEGARLAVGITRAAGLITKGNFILGNVGDTHETIKETIAFAKDCDIDFMQHTFLSPLPGSDLFDTVPRMASWKDYSTFKIHYVPDGLTQKDMKKYSKRFWREFYLRPSMWLRYLNILGIKKLWKAIKTFLKFYL